MRFLPFMKSIPRGSTNSATLGQIVLRRLRRNRMTMFALRVVMFLVLVALLADFIAYDKPYYCKYKGKTYFPIFYDYLTDLGLYQWDKELILADWKSMEMESSFWPPVRYVPYKIDGNNASKSPFAKQNVSHWKFWHFLGTDRDGRDVLSGLIHGTRISLSIGLVAIGIAAAIGLLFGAAAGYYGDNRLQLSRVGIVFLCLGLFAGYFYGFQVRSYVLRDAFSQGIGPIFLQLGISLLIVVACVGVFLLLAKPLERIPFLGKKRFIWLDFILSRILEIFISIPVLLLILTVLAVTQQESIYLTMVLIGFLSWPGLALYMRGEVLRTRAMEFVEAARALGFRDRYIVLRHVIPNSISPVLILIAFGVAGAIGLEAALSFLGIGVPQDTVTWGSILNSAQSNIRSWWLAVFPSIAIFTSITALNLLGEGLRDALDPQLTPTTNP